MDETGYYYVKWNNPDHIFSHMRGLYFKNYRTGHGGKKYIYIYVVCVVYVFVGKKIRKWIMGEDILTEMESGDVNGTQIIGKRGNQPNEKAISGRDWERNGSHYILT